jgi:glycosyltransferase involved in cell wall biosynthesis
MRITFVLPPVDLSGGVRVVAVYAERLKRRGHDVVVVSQPHRQPTWREWLRNKVRNVPYPAEARPGPSHLDEVDVEHHVLDDPRPVTAQDVPDADVVIATWWETAEWVAALPESKGAKAYFLQHHEVFPGLPGDRVNATWRLPMHKICVARWLVELARHQFGDPNATLVPNAVDLDLFHAPPRGKQATPTVGVMYSTAGFKGCDVSLAAFNLARQRVPRLRLVSFGTAARPAPQLPLPEGATYVSQPPQAQIREIYGQCDAWLFGSRTEGFGLPVLEAMACRTPVIATRVGAAPDLIADGTSGVLVAPDDAEAMADAIVRLVGQDDRDWRQMSDKALAAASRYTWDDATDLFETALKTAVRRARHGQLVGV